MLFRLSAVSCWNIVKYIFIAFLPTVFREVCAYQVIVLRVRKVYVVHNITTQNSEKPDDDEIM